MQPHSSVTFPAASAVNTLFSTPSLPSDHPHTHTMRAQDCTRILRNVLLVLSAPGARLLLVERVMPVQPYHRSAASAAVPLAMDLEMMTAFGGRERSAAEWAILLAGAGFQWLGCKPIAGYINLITACPATAGPAT